MMKEQMSFVDMMVEIETFWGIEDYFICVEESEGMSSNKGDVGQDQDDKRSKLERLYREAVACRACSLWQTRTHLVFGEGDPDAELMFIGEAPGRDEDLQGRPFVGRAGELLTRLIRKMGFSRKEIYIGNVLKCRPPNNRNPLPSEIFACKRFIYAQIEIIQPKVICTLGKFSTSLLLGRKGGISSLRGKVYDYNGIKVVPTFHPAYLLRNPKDKVLVWQDAQLILKLLGKRQPH